MKVALGPNDKYRTSKLNCYGTVAGLEVAFYWWTSADEIRIAVFVVDS